MDGSSPNISVIKEVDGGDIDSSKTSEMNTVKLSRSQRRRQQRKRSKICQRRLQGDKNAALSDVSKTSNAAKDSITKNAAKPESHCSAAKRLSVVRYLIYLIYRLTVASILCSLSLYYDVFIHIVVQTWRHMMKM